jgi:hypothetical protein
MGDGPVADVLRNPLLSDCYDMALKVEPWGVHVVPARGDRAGCLRADR